MESVEKLSPIRRLLIGGVTLAMAGAGFLGGRYLLRPVKPVSQPITFNHRVHIEKAELECETCHEYYKTELHSGLPGSRTCLECHSEAVTDSPEEQRVRELTANGGSFEFRKLFKMPDHVYYSHARHVVAGQVECVTCHGDVAATTAPPEKPLVHLTMDTCIDCHEARGVGNSCAACHR